MTSTADESVPATRRWLQRIALALGTTLLALAAAEGALRLFASPAEAGLGPDTRGFDPEAALVVGTGSPADGFQAHVRDAARHEIRIPPKGARRRVLLVGGSNTLVLPGEFLQTLLDEAGAPQQHEVINLGVAGYGSTRERVLFDQALVLEPDVVFVYSGHNEFIENEFRSQVDAGAVEWQGEAASLLRKLKSVDLVTSEMRRIAREAVPKVDARTRYVEHFASFTPEEREAVYRTFRENLEAMARSGRQHGVRVILGTVVRNMFWTPMLSKSGLPPGSPEEREFEQTWAAALASIPPQYVADVFPSMVVSPFDWGIESGEWWAEFYRPPAADLVAAPAFPQVAPAVLEAAHGLGARWTQLPLDEGALWTPPSLWDKRAHRVMQTMAAIHAGDPDAPCRAALAAATEKLERALELAPEHAGARFALALCLRAVSRDPERVLSLLDEAGELDWAPTGGNTRINAIIHDVTRSVEGVELLDADATFRARAPGGLVDFQIIMDSNHLNPGSKLLLLQDLAQLVTGSGAVAQR